MIIKKIPVSFIFWYFCNFCNSVVSISKKYINTLYCPIRGDKNEERNPRIFINIDKHWYEEEEEEEEFLSIGKERNEKKREERKIDPGKASRHEALSKRNEIGVWNLWA